jgi:hypothetical protein
VLHQIASEDATFSSRVITGDKSWMNGYEPETKQQSSQLKNEGIVKSMLIILLDIKGTVHKELFLAGRTVNSTTTVTLYGKCMKMCEDFTSTFGNERPGCCIMTKSRLTLPFFFSSDTFFCQKSKMIVIPTHPTHLIWPLETFVFPRLKIKLKSRSQAVLNIFTVHAFHDAFKKMAEVPGMMHTHR